jgi:Ca2+-binding RTX toxin-like protein
MSLTANEQFLLEMINRARLDPAGEAARYGLADLNRGLAPGTITGAALQPLAYSPFLQDAARGHSKWMLDADIFSHTGANGSSPTDRMIAAGFSFAGSGYSGGVENISRRGTTGTLDLAASIDSHHSGLFLSDGHRRNMMGADYREAGLAQVAGLYTDNGTVFNTSMLTQNFAASAKVFVTGVVYGDADGDAFYSRGEGKAGVNVAIVGGASAVTAAAGGYGLAAAAGLVSFTIGGASVLVSTAKGNAKVDLVNGDRILSSADITLLSGSTHLTLLGVGDINGTGSAGNDTITGTRGANVLSGRGGSDTLTGGLGNDTYVDPQGDTIVETVNGGIDTVQSSLSFGLEAVSFIENLILTGSAAISGTGDGLANIITGNAGSNVLKGLAGNDTLHGGAGNDTLDGGTDVDAMAGGEGDDVFWFDDIKDVASEAVGQGTDTVFTPFGGGLAANIENMVLTGVVAVNVEGNALANVITANAAANLLRGGDGNDTLRGLDGNDTLLGGTGIDRLEGGTGNDVYYVDNAATSTMEAANAGIDTVYSSVGRALYANVENMILTGTAALNADGNGLANVMTGNAAGNVLRGGDGNDTLRGMDGNDTLVAGTGIDRLEGGAGNDVYHVDNAATSMIEAANGGIDTVYSSVGLYLYSNIENMILTGVADLSVDGNAMANRLTGNAGANRLRGAQGDDFLDGGAGSDTLAGGDGRDEILPGSDAVRDVFVFYAVADSTGAKRDFMRNPDLAGEDKLDFHIVPKSIAAQVNAGALNEASFDADLALAIGAAQMGAGQAVLFDPSSGSSNWNGHVYLVVDANYVAGYQAGQDYVVQISGMLGTLSLDDFI